MKYINPTYEKEKIDVRDIVLASSGINLTEIDKNNAKVSASLFEILGW